VIYFAVLVLCAVCAFLIGRARLLQMSRQLDGQAHAQADRLRAAAQDEAEQLLAGARRTAGETRERRRQQLTAEIEKWRELNQKSAERIERRRQLLQRSEELGKHRAELLTAREQALGQIERRRTESEAARVRADQQARRTLFERAEETDREARDRLVAEWVEEARAEAKDQLRQIEQGQIDPEHGREARRIMDIASQRYHGHYLTERLLSNIPVPPGTAQRLGGPDLVNLHIIGEVANVKLTLSDDELAIRLEGQDSFGREIARRAIARFGRALPRGGEEAIRQAVKAIADELDKETVELGRRAFKELEIPRAHPEIVRLVGRLNYRTSYTQNQWKHAIEAAFLCGMIASELKLDIKIARRAALLHDIGKALTHEIDGSHAVIGADYARRLGEAEVVANAIGAHHLDEPFSSPYAYIVAAADAMSGARPGARHEPADNYVERIDALHRIASGFPGVDRAYAVQAGREVRVYVKEGQISDERAAEMSSEIAEQISAGLVFPGQIKVTVIREVTAVAVAN
jgi:ribonuclease Y